MLEYFLPFCVERRFCIFLTDVENYNKLWSDCLLPCLIFPGNWANALGFFNVTVLKVAEKRESSFHIMHFSFISEMRGLGLRCVTLKRQRMDVPSASRNLRCVSPRWVLKDRWTHLWSKAP